jgi:hypothetical protein
VFTHGDGPFVQAPIGDALVFHPTSATHGVVAPRRAMPLFEFQQALAASQVSWRLVRTPDEA